MDGFRFKGLDTFFIAFVSTFGVNTLNPMSMSTVVEDSLPRERRIGRNLPQPVPFDIKHRIKCSLRNWHRMGCEQFGNRIELPSISFDLRGVSTMAQAWVGENHVQLNASALMADEAKFSSEVIPHEVAHLLAYRMYGSEIAPHGEEWQGVMRAFGVEPNVTYDIEYEAETSGPYIYECLCGVHGISARRHNVLWRSRGTKVLECQKCGEVLRFREIAGQTTARLNEKTPTSKMLEFATQLAKRSGVPLPAEARRYISSCRAFIEKHKNSVTSVSTALEGSAAGCRQRDEMPAAPSEAQLRYALSIASQKRIDIPPEISRNRKLLSAWIDRHK